MQPPEGVKEGQQFVADEIPAGSPGHAIPTGRWRNGCWDLFANGACHPMLCLACWCCPLALGQVMTRMGLNAVGDEIPRDRRPSHPSAFKIVAAIFLLFFVATRSFDFYINYTYVTKVAPALSYYSNGTEGNRYGYTSYLDQSYYSKHPDDDAHSYMYYEGNAPLRVPFDVLDDIGSIENATIFRNAIRFLFWFYMLVVLTRARAHVRKRYSIPNNCAGCEDCCCAFWLPCCTTLQIARHTADYDTYGASCCTETGLPLTAPEVV
jgi:hypothetical protein